RNQEVVSRQERWESLWGVLPILTIIVGVIGGLYSGVTTPTEAAAFGALLSFLVCALQRRLTWEVVKTSVLEAVMTTARIFFVAVGAVLLTKFLALSGVTAFLGSQVDVFANNPLTLILATVVVYLIL